MSNDKSDVLVLGGGVIGLSCAHYLLQAGRSVRVLEKGRAGGATSHGNCGTITPSHAPPLAAPGMLLKALKWMFSPDAPLYVKPRFDPALGHWLLRFAQHCNRRDWRRNGIAKGQLLLTSRQMLEKLVRDHRLDCEFETAGLRYVFRDDKAFAQSCAEIEEFTQFGIDTRILDSHALAQAEPSLLPNMAGAIHFQGDAHLRPDRFVDALAKLVLEQGGVIEEDTSVLGFDRTAGHVSAVETTQGKRFGTDIIAAFGPWLPTVLADLRLPLPVQPGKGYSITYSRPVMAPVVPIMLKERSVCVTAWDSGFRLGSTMEFSGFDGALNRTRLDALERAARDYLHYPVGPEKREEWFGWRPMTWDDLPILGVAPGYDNLWLAGGHGMMGMSMSAATGHLLADMICHRPHCIDAAPFSPQRFV